MLTNENVGEAPSNKFNAFVRKSVDRATSAVSMSKVVASDKKEDMLSEEDFVLSEKKEHRRAQVRKAQIEHRQRKETHIKTLEQEISDLRDMIDSVEKQSHYFNLENAGLRSLLQKKESVNRLNVPVRKPAPQSSHIRTPVSNNSDTLGDQKSFEVIASLGLDQSLNISCLQLKSGNDFGMAASPSGSSARNMDGMTGGYNVKSEGMRFDRFDERRGVQMDVSNDDPEVALLAINFILALEHPCRTHFLPRGTGPIDGLPVWPAHVPSGHELMASTYPFSQAPVPVFQNMHSHQWTTQTPQPPPTPTPWCVPFTPQEELKKLWLMSRSLSKNDWEITPVQAWFLLMDSLGVEVLMRRGVVEELKRKLGELVNCFGFGATMNLGLFQAVVREIERKGVGMVSRL